MTASRRSPAPVIIPNACRPLYNVGRRTAAIPLRGAIIAATHVDIVQSMQAVAIHIIIINTELEGGRDSRQPIHTLKKTRRKQRCNSLAGCSWRQDRCLLTILYGGQTERRGLADWRFHMHVFIVIFITSAGDSVAPGAKSKNCVCAMNDFEHMFSLPSMSL